MSSAATQHAHTGVTNHSVSSRQPFVFIDGQPRVDLWVRRLTMDGVLDVRIAELVPQRIGAGHEQTQRALLEKLEGRRVRIAQPVALAGDSTTWMPLLQGIVRQASQQLSGDDDELSIIVVDDWQQTLDHRIAPEHLDAFAAGSWTLDDFVRRLGTLGGLTFSTAGLDAMQLQERVTPPSSSRPSTTSPNACGPKRPTRSSVGGLCTAAPSGGGRRRPSIPTPVACGSSDARYPERTRPECWRRSGPSPPGCGRGSPSSRSTCASSWPAPPRRCPPTDPRSRS